MLRNSSSSLRIVRSVVVKITKIFGAWDLLTCAFSAQKLAFVIVVLFAYFAISVFREVWEHTTFLEILDDLEYRDTMTNKRKKLDAPLDSAIPCTNSACRKEHFSSKLQPSFFVLLAFGRMPLVSQWIRANLFEILSTCLLELCTRRSTSYGRSTFRTTVFHRFPSVISMQERESKRSLPHFTFSTLARMVSVAVFGFPWKAIWLLFFFGRGEGGRGVGGGSGERERMLRGRGRPMALSLMWHACCGRDAKRKTQREGTVRNNARKRKQKIGSIRWPSDRILMHELMATLERFHLTCSLHEGLDDHGLVEWSRTEWSLVVTWVNSFPGKWLSVSCPIFSQPKRGLRVSSSRFSIPSRSSIYGPLRRFSSRWILWWKRSGPRRRNGTQNSIKGTWDNYRHVVLRVAWCFVLSSTLWKITCRLKNVNGHEMNGHMWSSGLAILPLLDWTKRSEKVGWCVQVLKNMD